MSGLRFAGSLDLYSACQTEIIVPTYLNREINPESQFNFGYSSFNPYQTE